MERFLVRPEIALSVEYGPDGVACQMMVSPKPPKDKKGEGNLLPTGDVAQILDEVVPPGTRGTDIGPVVSVVSSVNSVSGEIYENVIIMHTLHDCSSLKPKCESAASVTFRREICGNPSK
jgi:hypothetical protein